MRAALVRLVVAVVVAGASVPSALHSHGPAAAFAAVSGCSESDVPRSAAELEEADALLRVFDELGGDGWTAPSAQWAAAARVGHAVNASHPCGAATWDATAVSCAVPTGRSPASAWAGVSCDSSFRVTELRLRSVGLSGLLDDAAPALSSLARLQVLDASYNAALGGTLPSSLYRSLTELQDLRVAHTNVTLALPDPDAGETPAIMTLHVSYSGLAGTVPPALMRVATTLELQKTGVSGPIPDVVNPTVRTFYASFTSLNGTVPASFLGAVHRAAFGRTQITGALPSVANDDLQYLAADESDLRGPIPPTLLSSQLQELYLSWTRVGEGTDLHDLPWEGAVSLFSVGLFDCGLGGHLPAEYPPNIRELYLGDNPGLSGTLGRSLSVKPVQYLYVQNTGISGTIPDDLNTDDTLLEISLANLGDSFGGTIPAALCPDPSLCSLRQVNISQNRGIAGTLPPWSTMAPRLVVFDANGCSLEGTIPALGAATEAGGRVRSGMVAFVVADNRLGGAIPAVGAALNLTLFDVSLNQLAGMLPADWSMLSRLKDVFVNGNALTGSVPQSLLALPGLVNVDFSNNQLSGALVEDHNTAVSPVLQYVAAGGNGLSGTVPDQLLRSTSMTALLLSGNRFSAMSKAPLPTESVCATIDLSFNDLTGPLPQWGNATTIVALRFRHNRFTGVVGPELVPLRTADHVQLSLNRLSGFLPEYHVQRAQHLDVLAGNIFQCPVPELYHRDVRFDSYRCEEPVADALAPDTPLKAIQLSLGMLVVGALVFVTTTSGARSSASEASVPGFERLAGHHWEARAIAQKARTPAHLELPLYMRFITGAKWLCVPALGTAAALALVYSALPSLYQHRLELALTLAFAGTGDADVEGSSTGGLFLLALVLMIGMVGSTLWAWYLHQADARATRWEIDALIDRAVRSNPGDAALRATAIKAMSHRHFSTATKAAVRNCGASASRSGAAAAALTGDTSPSSKQSNGPTSDVAPAPTSTSVGTRVLQITMMLVAVLIMGVPHMLYLLLLESVSSNNEVASMRGLHDGHAEADDAGEGDDSSLRTVIELMEVFLSGWFLFDRIVAKFVAKTWLKLDRFAGAENVTPHNFSITLVNIQHTIVALWGPVVAVLAFHPRCLLFSWSAVREASVPSLVSACNRWKTRVPCLEGDNPNEDNTLCSCTDDIADNCVTQCVEPVIEERVARVSYPFEYDNACPGTFVELYSVVFIVSIMLTAGLAAVRYVRIRMRVYFLEHGGAELLRFNEGRDVPEDGGARTKRRGTLSARVSRRAKVAMSTPMRIAKYMYVGTIPEMLRGEMEWGYIMVLGTAELCVCVGMLDPRVAFAGVLVLAAFVQLESHVAGLLQRLLAQHPGASERMAGTEEAIQCSTDLRGLPRGPMYVSGITAGLLAGFMYGAGELPRWTAVAGVLVTAACIAALVVLELATRKHSRKHNLDRSAHERDDGAFVRPVSWVQCGRLSEWCCMCRRSGRCASVTASDDAARAGGAQSGDVENGPATELRSFDGGTSGSGGGAEEKRENGHSQHTGGAVAGRGGGSTRGASSRAHDRQRRSHRSAQNVVNPLVLHDAEHGADDPSRE